eukprot:CAMPEP_0184734942 /NCGR_PEP_ID=MMETSP0314-20130426/61630_1 /TAXON_ID=38298 /ORGANISM="Rhodella maculata, Strain CCMP 736" /LENGTH=190 /DNA_ID=CAMNT_0027201959 /DNA_START=144 /DNA_END=716 /DNA_ORIENTATION=+
MKTAVFPAPARPTLDRILDTELLVYSTAGEPATLAGIIADESAGGAPVVVLWMRHCVCPLCTKHVKAMLKLQLEVDFKLVVVGGGTVQQAAEFANEVGLNKRDMWTDPLRKTFAAVGFAKNLAAPAKLFPLKNVLEKFVQVNAQEAGDPWEVFQLGGAAVVLEGNRIAYLHKDDYAGDFAKENEISKLCA